MLNPKFEGLDGMRGIAAIFVLLRHTGNYWGPFPFGHSYLAVDVFFVLSGFVVAYAYERRFDDASMTVRSFAVTRLVRLYPLYLLGLLLGLVWAITKMSTGAEVYAISKHDLVRVVVLSLVFLPSHLDSALSLFPLNAPSWSLFYELTVNGGYAVTRRFLRTPVVLVLASLSAVVLAYASFKVGNLDFGIMAGPKTMTGAFARAAFGMALGLLIFRVYTRGYRLPSIVAKPLAPILVMSAVLALPDFGAIDWAVDLVAVVIVFPACVLWSACIPTPKKFLRAFSFLGTLSYPLYVLHMPIVNLGELLLGTEIARLRPAGGLMLTVALLALSVVVVHHLDEPIRRTLTRRLFPTRI